MAVRAIDAEIAILGKVQVVSIEQALCMDKSRDFRCRECGGKVRPHHEGKDGHPAHFEHRQGYHRDDCSRCHPYTAKKKK